jgi:hypothetical protein
MNTNAKSQSKNNTNYNSNKMMTETLNSNNHYNQRYLSLLHLGDYRMIMRII